MNTTRESMLRTAATVIRDRGLAATTHGELAATMNSYQLEHLARAGNITTIASQILSLAYHGYPYLPDEDHPANYIGEPGLAELKHHLERAATHIATNPIMQAAVQLSNEPNTIDLDFPDPCIAWESLAHRCLSDAAALGQIPDCNIDSLAWHVARHFHGIITHCATDNLPARAVEWVDWLTGYQVPQKM